MNPVRGALRFTRRVAVAGLAGVVILTILLALLWTLMGGFLAERISTLANQRFFADRTTRLYVGRVSGSLFSDVTFTDVRLERQIGDEWRSAVFADRVQARYDLWGLARGRTELKAVRIYGPLIEISQDSTGRWVLPVGNAPGDVDARGLKRFKLSEIDITGGRLHLIGRQRGWEASNLALRATMDVNGDDVWIDMADASFDMLEPMGRVSSLSGQLRVEGARLRGESLYIGWSESSLQGGFSIDPADSTAGFQAGLRLDRIPLGRLKGFFDVDAIPSIGHASGTVRLAGGWEHFDFGADLNGLYEDRDVEAFAVQGRRAGSAITVDDIQLTTRDLAIDSGTVDVELAGGGSIDARLEIRHVQVDSIPVASVRWIPGTTRGRLDLAVSNFKAGRGNLSVLAEIALTGGRLFDVDLRQIEGAIDFVKGRDVRISDMVLVLPDSGRVTGDGIVHPGDVLDFDFVAETGDWASLRSVIAIPGLEASGRAVGRLVGTGRQPEIDISGDFVGVAGWNMAADTVRIERLSGPFYPEAEFDGQVKADVLRSLGRIIDHVDMDFHWREPRLTFPRLSAVDNDTLIETHGYTDFLPNDDGMDVTLSGGTLTIGDLTWTPGEAIHISGRGPFYRMEPVPFTSPAGRSVAEADFDTDRRTMDSWFRDTDIDLAVMAGGLKSPEFHGGRLTGDLRLRGAIRRPDSSGRIRLHDYRWGDAVVDSAYFQFDAQDRRVIVGEGWMDSGPGRLVVAGGLDMPEHAWIIWSKWRAREPIAWEHVVMNGFQVRGDGVDLTRWAEWNPEIDGLAGRASGWILLSGPVSEPSFQTDLELVQLRYDDYRADTLLVSGRHAASQLRLDNLRAARGQAVTEASGRIPIKASIWPAAFKLLEAPMSVTVDMPQADLTLLPLLAPGIAKAAGNLSGRVRLAGTPKRIQAFGDLALENGTFQVKDREEVITDLTAQIHLDSTTVEVVSLTGRQGDSGRLSGNGTFELGVDPARAYKFELDLEDFVMRQSADYAARFDGHFEVVPLRLADGSVRPMTIGDILVSRAEIIREFDQPQSVPEPDKVYFYSLTIDAPRGIFIVNDVVDMELSGTLTARRTPERSELIGELDILRGHYELLLRRFRIVEGRLSFNRLDVVDPEIDIVAETNDAEYIISVHITGEASNPVLEFAARKPREEDAVGLSEGEILKRLVPGGVLAGQGSEDLGVASSDLGVNVLTSSVQVILSEIQRDVARRLGFDEIRLESPGAADQGSYGKVSVSKWVTPEVSVRYSQGLSGYQEQDLSVEYRLGRLLFLRGEIIRRRTLEEEYNIDLRFWHEY